MSPAVKPRTSNRLFVRTASFMERDNQCSTRKTGAFVVSLDFELHWGVRDHQPLNQAERKRLLAARAGVPRILDLFQEFEIHATWAAVGFLFARSKQEAEAFAPALRPSYSDPRLDPYREPIGENESEDPFHFAPGLIALIAAHPGQEIASHTFSHYYCMEPGQNQDQFAADVKSAVAIASNYGYTLRSFVFPRNQVQPTYVECLKSAGISAFRGNESVSAKASASFAEQRRPSKRIGRLLDAYLDVYGDQTIPWPDTQLPVSLNASRYLRSHRAELAAFESLLIRRIEKAMRHAATKGEIFHLWWHPEDFASDYYRNLGVLRRVLEIYDECRIEHGMQSLSMCEVARLTSQRLTPAA